MIIMNPDIYSILKSYLVVNGDIKYNDSLKSRELFKDEIIKYFMPYSEENIEMAVNVIFKKILEENSSTSNYALDNILNDLEILIIKKIITPKSFLMILLNCEKLTPYNKEFWSCTFKILHKYIHQIDYKGIRDLINPLFQKLKLLPHDVNKNMIQQLSIAQSIFYMLLDQENSAYILPGYLVVNELRKLCSSSNNAFYANSQYNSTMDTYDDNLFSSKFEIENILNMPQNKLRDFQLSLMPLPHWSMAWKFWEYIESFKPLAQMVFISGRDRMFPVVAFSSTTNSIWRLESNTFKFPIRGFLPYPKCYLIPQHNMVTNILNQPYSRDLVCNILGLKKQHKLRCPLLEEALVEIIFATMLAEGSGFNVKSSATAPSATTTNIDDEGKVKNETFASNDIFLGPGAQSQLVWQHLSSQVIFFVLFQFCTFSRLIKLLVGKIENAIATALSPIDYRSNMKPFTRTSLELFGKSRDHLSWLLLQFISGSIQNTPAFEFLPLIRLFNILYPETMVDGLKPLPVPTNVLIPNVNINATNGDVTTNKRFSSNAASAAFETVGDSNGVRNLAGACIWIHVNKKFQQHNQSSNIEKNVSNTLVPIVNNSSTTTTTANFNELSGKGAEDRQGGEQQLESNPATAPSNIPHGDQDVYNTSVLEQSKVSPDGSFTTSPLLEWPLPYTFKVHVEFLQAVLGALNNTTYGRYVDDDDDPNSAPKVITLNGEQLTIDFNIYKDDRETSKPDTITNYTLPLLCNAFSTSAENFTAPMTKIIDFLTGSPVPSNPNETVVKTTRSDNNTIPLSMEFLDSLSVHAKMSLIHNIVTSILKFFQSKSTSYLSYGLLETYSRLLIYMEIESLGIKGYITHLLPNLFKNQIWSALYSLLEMFNYRLHHIQPHYRFQMLSYLQSLIHHISSPLHSRVLQGLNLNQQLQLHSCLENLILHVIMGLGNSEVQPQIARFQGDPKSILSDYSEELNRVLILSIGRAIYLTGGSETLSGNWCYDIISNIMQITPHSWSPHTLPHFPSILGKYFSQNKIIPEDKGSIKGIVDEEFKNMLNFVNNSVDVTNYLASLMANPAGPCSPSASSTTTYPPRALILCLLWRIGVERRKQGNHPSNQNGLPPDYDGHSLRALLYNFSTNQGKTSAGGQNSLNSNTGSTPISMFAGMAIMMRGFVDYLIGEFEACATPNTPHHAPLASKYLDALNEMIWSKGLFPLDRLLMVLILRDHQNRSTMPDQLAPPNPGSETLESVLGNGPSGENSNASNTMPSQMALFIAQLLLLKPPESLGQRFSDFLATYPPKHWLSEDWYARHLSFCHKYPEKYFNENEEDEYKAPVLSSSSTAPFPTLFGNIYFRLIPLLDLLIHRYLELPTMYKSLGTLLDRFGALYRYHPRPLSYLYSTLFYYEKRLNTEPTGYVVKRKLISAIVGSLLANASQQSVDNCEWYLSCAFKQYTFAPHGKQQTQSANQANSHHLPNHSPQLINSPLPNNVSNGGLNSLQLTDEYYINLYQRLIKALKSTSPFPTFDWRFNEFSNEISHYIHVICIELLSCPAPGNKISNDLVNLMIKRNSQIPNYRDDHQHWLNAISLTMSGLPDEFSVGFYDEILNELKNLGSAWENMMPNLKNNLNHSEISEKLQTNNSNNSSADPQSALPHLNVGTKRKKGDKGLELGMSKHKIRLPQPSVMKSVFDKKSLTQENGNPTTEKGEPFNVLNKFSNLFSCRDFKTPQPRLLTNTLPEHLKDEAVCDFYDSSCSVLRLEHAIWLNATVGQLSALPKFIRQKVKPLVYTERQFLYVCHLIGPFLQRFHLERTRCLLELTIEIYEMLERVDSHLNQDSGVVKVGNLSDKQPTNHKPERRFEHLNTICGFLYHIKYMFTGDGIRNDVERYVKNYSPQLQTRLRFICSAPSTAIAATTSLPATGSTPQLIIPPPFPNVSNVNNVAGTEQTRSVVGSESEQSFNVAYKIGLLQSSQLDSMPLGTEAIPQMAQSIPSNDTMYPN